MPLTVNVNVLIATATITIVNFSKQIMIEMIMDEDY